MGIKGNPRKYHKKFKFLVEIEGVGYAGFSKCSALEAEVETIEYREGGAIIAEKDPGLVNVSNVTLERGATMDKDLWNWFKEVIDLASGLGDIDDDFKRDGDIIQQDRDGLEVRRWSIYRVWPRKFVAGEWDNEANENVIESVELSIQTFDMTPV